MGPAAAAGITLLLWVTYRYGPSPELAGVLGLAALVFAGVYAIQAWFAWRSAHWPKPLMYLCVTAAAATGSLPSLGLFAGEAGRDRLEVLINNSPVGTVVFLAAAVLFGGLQVIRERQGFPADQ